MTSLAQKLKQLAVSHTQAVFAPDKSRASLLFDPKDAANLDKEAIFAIGKAIGTYMVITILSKDISKTGHCSFLYLCFTHYTHV